MSEPAQNGGVVDVVVVTSNSRDLILKCLQHLTDPELGKIVAVDNASTDGTVDAVREEFPAVETLHLDPHSGLSRAFNLGAARTTAPMVLFLNDDVFAKPGAVSRLVAALAARPDAASAGARLVDPGEHGATQDRYRPRAFPTLMTFVMTLTGLERLWPGNPWSGAQRVNDRDTVEADQPAGACLVVRRSAFDAVGGWDEGFWFWFEDVDMSRRLADEGPSLYVAGAAVEHVGGGTVLRWNRAEILARTHHGILLYGYKHFSGLRRIGLGLLLLVLSLVAIVVFAFVDRDVVRVRARIVRGALALIGGKQPPALR